MTGSSKSLGLEAPHDEVADLSHRRYQSGYAKEQ